MKNSVCQRDDVRNARCYLLGSPISLQIRDAVQGEMWFGYIGQVEIVNGGASSNNPSFCSFHPCRHHLSYIMAGVLDPIFPCMCFVLK